MWPTLDRARRRLTGGVASLASAASGATTSATDSDDTPATVDDDQLEDTVIILGSAELDLLRAALMLTLGDAVERPDTPARFERALSLVLSDRAVPGHARVLRRPAGLSTPETWEIHLDGVDAATATAVRDASRTGSLLA